MFNLYLIYFPRNVNDTSIIISISRVILILSKRLSTNIEVDLNKYELQSLINFIWLHLDHYLDGVRHFARDTMINIIKIKGIVYYLFIYFLKYIYKKKKIT